MQNLSNKTIFLLLFFAISLLARDINIDSIAQDAKKTAKHIFIYLHKTNCSYCESMQDFTLDNEKVKALLKKEFIIVDINVKDNNVITYQDFKGSGYDFAISIGHNFYPSSIFIDETSEIIYEIAGYQDENKFLNILKYISSDSYKKIEYDTFIKKQKKKQNNG